MIGGLLSAVLVISFLPPAFGADEPQIPFGTFAFSQADSRCIELTPDGSFFLSVDTFRFQSGTWKVVDGKIICSIGERSLELSVRDGQLVDQKRQVWKRRDDCLQPIENSTPLTIVVLNRKTLEPVTNFQYSLEMETEKGLYSLLHARPVPVESADGSFQIDAPPSCLLRVEVTGRDVLTGFGSVKTITVRSDDQSRRYEIVLEAGVRTAGVVVDSENGQPIADASVAPMVFTAPLFTPDRDRQVQTDSRGQFVLYGVDLSLGIHASHEEYFETEKAELPQPDTDNLTIELKKGPSVAGTVIDAAGKPMSGVEVSDGRGKETTTNGNGEFRLPSPEPSRDGEYLLEFERANYLRTKHRLNQLPSEPLRIQMKPRPVLRGTVRSEAGDEISTFQIVAGTGKEPDRHHCESQRVSNSNKFEITIPVDEDYDNEDRVWVGIKADGFAAWQTILPEWENENVIDVRLNSGCRGSGRVTNRSRFGETIEAHLLPQRTYESSPWSSWQTSERQEMGRMTVVVDPQGNFQFSSLAPGRYLLALSGPDVSPFSALVEIGEHDRELGEFTLRGTGTISGIVWNRPESDLNSDEDPPLPTRHTFAEGNISFVDSAGHSNGDEFRHLEERSFRTDEQGRFRIDNVPIGRVRVSLPRWVSADMIMSDTLVAGVSEGENTEVEFFGPSRREKVRCHVIVGDDTEVHRKSGLGRIREPENNGLENFSPRFSAVLELLDDHQGSAPSDEILAFQTTASFSISDVGPADYDLVVLDDMRDRRYAMELFRTHVHVGLDPVDVNVTLGAASLTGAIEVDKKTHASACVIAIGQETRLLRIAACNDDGSFCLRYLKDDTYEIFAHSENGWCRLPQTKVSENIQDLGSHQLQPGATLRIRLPLAFVHDQNVSIMATHESGAVSPRLSGDQLRFGPVELPHLWPGQWDVIVRRGNSVLLQKNVVVGSSGVSEVDLTN